MGKKKKKKKGRQQWIFLDYLVATDKRTKEDLRSIVKV